MTIAAEAIASPTRARVLFQDGNVYPLARQMDRGRNSTYPGPNNNYRTWFHNSLNECEITG